MCIFSQPGTRKRSRDVPPQSHPAGEEDSSHRPPPPHTEGDSSGGSTSQLPERPSSAKGRRTLHVDPDHTPPSPQVEEQGDIEGDSGSTPALLPSGLV